MDKDILYEPIFFYFQFQLQKNEKMNDPLFHKVQKTPFLAVFGPNLTNFFFEIGLPHIRGFKIMYLCAKNHKE